MTAQKLYELAGCIINDTQGRILLLHRNTEAWQHWEIPGGKIEPGESAEDAAAREVNEELGVDVAIGNLLATKEFAEKDYKIHYSWYEAKIIAGTPTIIETETFDNLAYFSAEELKKADLPTSNGVKAFLTTQL